MILYQPNRNWFKDIRHLAVSYTIQRVMRYVLYTGLFATLICAIEEFTEFMVYIPIDLSIFSLLGIVLSIFLVFRTNTAYDRWWEGRKQWGALVNHSRNLAIYVQTMWPPADHDIRAFMAKHISNFCLGLSEHLRDGVILDKLVYLTDEERDAYANRNHIPNFIAQLIYERIADAHRKGTLSNGDYINIKPQHQALLDILGACERIKKTPIPFSYNVYLKVYITAYALVLPLGLITTFSWWTIPIAMFVVFALLGVELLAEEIEDPFGLDCNDLPTTSIAHTIKGNVYEILESRTPKAPAQVQQLYEKYF